MIGTGLCRICGRQHPLISSRLGICGPCIKAHPDRALPMLRGLHASSRLELGLPGSIPRSSKGTVCDLCPNRCELGIGELGFCGLYSNREGRAVRSLLAKGEGLVSCYKDPHPTNCVASWCCAGGSHAGYPTYSVSPGAERGWCNAAVFLGSCTYHCLFCQNAESWRRMVAERKPVISDRKLARRVLEDPSYTCLCWFGGCPSSQMEFVLSASTRMAEEKGNRILRICLETNGNIEPRFLKPMAEVSLVTGGGMKFDLKFMNPHLNEAICGASNRQVLDNFRSLGSLNQERTDPAFLRASTLMIPGYVDAAEVGCLARMIAEVDPTIPYSLLAYHPCYLMSDLPMCTRDYVRECRRAALSAGLSRVRIGNLSLVA